MTIASGTRLGHYEILTPLGAGGMGEVWRARDTRLGRDVALKILPADFSSDAERLKRFEREARAASALSHPNIVTIYEVARVDSTSFIAMELVSGKTLRTLIGGAPVPLRRLLAIAPQIAEGIARAHAAGIVHRDLKPENVMVTDDGHVKILDFGLAKLTHPELDSAESKEAPTVSAGTRPGIAMGTVGYMSPEQASGHPVDYRSDQFSLGSVLYEMATGAPAFMRPTTAQTLAAIIEDEPEPIGTKAPRTPAPLRWVIQRCLAKEPKGRYASTEDLERELADLRDHVSELSTSAGIAIEEPRRRGRLGPVGLAAACVAILGAVFWLGRRVERAGTSQPRFRQLTFRGAGIGTARFAPDGQTIVFSAQTEGRPPELFSMRLDSPEVRSLGLPPAHILSISNSGEMAILLLRPFALFQRVTHLADQVWFRDPSLLDGTLAQASLAGGAPRELLEDVSFADWASAGGGLAVVHRVGNRNRLEFPIGRALYESEDVRLNYVRASPRGNRLAFKDWSVTLLKEADGRVHSLPEDVYEIAWSEASGEIWYTLPRGDSTELSAIAPGERNRLVARLGADFVLYDIAADGRVLLGRVENSTEILGSFPGETRERNLSYFNSSFAWDLAGSGDTLLFTDVGPGVGVESSSSYIRKTDGSAPKRLAPGWGTGALSPDGRLVLSGAPSEANHLLIPTGPGQTRNVSRQGIEFMHTESARSGFFPDGGRIFFTGYEGGRGRRIWVQDLEGGKPRAITPENTSRPVLLGDGRFVCARGPDFEWRLYPTDQQGEARKVAGILPGEEPFRSTPDGKLYVRGADELRHGETLMTTRVYRLDPWTGQRELWKEIPPRDPRTGGAVSTILFSADGKTCVWTHIRYSTELVLVEGLR